MRPGRAATAGDRTGAKGGRGGRRGVVLRMATADETAPPSPSPPSAPPLAAATSPSSEAMALTGFAWRGREDQRWGQE
eukprot:322942-Chlamydomonas_euryale.AAC.3